MIEQVREATERETELLRLSSLLAESTKNLEDTKGQLDSITDSSNTQQKELDDLKIAYEETCQLKAATDYEKSAAVSERDAWMREKKAADEQVGRGLKALAALESKMAAETKIFETKLDELMKKEWKAPAEVTKLKTTISTHEKTIRTLQSQIELKEKQANIPAMRDEMDNLRTQLAIHLTNENDTEEEKEEIQQMRDDLAELRRDYAAIETGADEALNEFSNEMDDMNQQVSGLQAVIKAQENEINELHAMKPRGLSKVTNAAAQSVPPAPNTTAPTEAQAKTPTAVPAAAPAVQTAPTDQAGLPTAGSSSAAIPSYYVYQAKCAEGPSQSEYRELTITEVAGQLMTSKQEMADNIINRKERLKLGSRKLADEQEVNASRLHDEEMGHNVELWHACMSDHGKKYIAFGHKRTKGFQPGKAEMN